MKTVRTLLYVISGLFMLSVVFVFLPWGWLNAFMGWFGPFAYPDDPMVQYTVKIMLAVFFWIGILMAAAVYRAESNPLFLLIFGLTFVSLAAVVLALVSVYQLPWLMYGDAVSAVVTGALFLVYRWQVTGQGLWRP
ncbi:MAG: hypothetical protein ACE5JZ_12095 [Kiloniellales bacterium]